MTAEIKQPALSKSAADEAPQYTVQTTSPQMQQAVKNLEQRAGALMQAVGSISRGAALEFNRIQQMTHIVDSALAQAAKIGAKTSGSELLEHLVKSASELDELNTTDAQQAVEGLDAVFEGCAAGITSDAQVLEKLLAVAGFLDDNYKHGAADILDKVALAYEYKGTPLGETRKEMYDHEAHNAENMWEIAKREIAENRKQDNVETHRGTAESLSTRYSPELPGVQLYHVADGVYQDSVTKKIFDFNTGFTTADGHKYPGGSVKHQTPALQQYAPVHRMFDTRVELSKRKASAEPSTIKLAVHHMGKITDTDVKAMRNWAADCEWGELGNDPDFLNALSDEEVIKGVERHYDGGVKQFLQDM